MSWFRWTQTALACPNCQLRSHSTTSDCNFLQIKRKKFQSNAQRRFHQRLTFRCLLAGSILRFRTRHVILLRRRRLMTTQKFSMSGKEIERIVKWKFDQKVMRSKDGNADGKHFLIWRNSETDFGTLRDESFANLLAIFENDFFILLSSVLTSCRTIFALSLGECCFDRMNLERKSIELSIHCKPTHLFGVERLKLR